MRTLHRIPVTSLGFVIALGSAALGAGCGDDAMPEQDHDHDHEHDHDALDGGHSHDTCGLLENCQDTVELKVGLQVASDDGSFTLRVVSHEQLGVHDNAIVVELSDQAGAPLKAAKITQDVFSVDCMHGGPRPPSELTTDGAGRVELMPYHLHGGPWDTTLEIEADGVTERVTLHLCVPLPDDAG
jgi:hypothetical protein